MTQTFDWSAEAAALKNTDFNPSMPLHVFLGEAVDGARFFQKYWANVKEPGTEKVVRYGLESAGEKKLPKTTGAEILSLVNEVQLAQTAYLLVVDPKSQAGLVERAQYLIGEISGVMEFFLDDGVEDDDDVRLATIQREAGERKESADALASTLHDYRILATPHRADLDGLGGFKIQLLDEAGPLVDQLREIPANQGPVSEEERKKAEKRNRLGILLHQRVNRVRSATRFIYRDHPEIVREATSTYMRRRRAEARRAALAKVTTPADVVTTPN